MDEHHTAVLNWQGTPEVAGRMEACANEHHAEVGRSEEGGEVWLSMTLRRNDLQTLRDDMDALLVALADIESIES